MREADAGPGRVLALAYGFFTLASGSRSVVQIVSDLGRAPIAYALSAVAAVIYAINTVVVVRADDDRHESLTRILFVLELVGVLAVGVASLVRPGWFPEPSVWSGFGIGYGFVPLVLPVLGLVWLRQRSR